MSFARVHYSVPRMHFVRIAASNSQRNAVGKRLKIIVAELVASFELRPIPLKKTFDFSFLFGIFIC